MTAMSKPLLRCVKGNPEPPIYRDARGGPLTYHSGAMLAQRDGTDLIEPASTRADLTILGMLGYHQSYVVTADRDRQFEIVSDKNGIGPFENSAAADQILAVDIGAIAWVVDDQTLAKTSNTLARSPAGYISHVDDNGKVWIDTTRAKELATMRLGGVL